MRILYYFIFIVCTACIPFACISTEKSSPSPKPDVKTQEPPPIEPNHVCTQVPCRPETAIKLQLDKDHYYDYIFPKTPYYYDKILTILPEEMIYLELEIKNDIIISAKVVENITNPNFTLTFKFEQVHQTDKDIHGMMLSIINPLIYNITYKAHLQKIDSSQPVPTSTCPVISKKNSYELWSYPAVQLIITDFILDTRKPETIICR